MTTTQQPSRPILTQIPELPIVAGLLLLLGACGGGGGSAPSAPPPPPPPPNTAPTADAGTDQTIAESSLIQLAGAGTDADGDTLAYSWTQVSGPPVTFADVSSPTTEVSVGAIAIETSETIELSLEVSDGRGGTASDTVILNVSSTDFVALFASDNSRVDKYDPETDMLLNLTEAGLIDPFVIDFAISPDGQWIAYRGADRSLPSVKVELYVGSTNGGGASVVSGPIQADGDIAMYAWSPDCLRLVYLADAERDQIREVYVVDRDGMNFAKLNPDLGAMPTVFLERPTWSADAQYVAYNIADLNTGAIIGIDVADTATALPNATRVTTLSVQEPVVGGFEWAPTGNRLIYSVRDASGSNTVNLYTVAANGTSNVSVLDPMRQAATRIRNFRWSPDGTQIAYMADQNTADVFELFVGTADGSSNTRASLALPAGSVVNDTFSRWSWSPDGARLGYLANPNGSFELFSVNPDGTDNATVNGTLVAAGAVSSFRWSPDSSWIAYRATQDDAGTEEIYVSRPNGGENLKLNPALAAGSSAGIGDWSPDGSRLAYEAQLAGDALPGNYVVRPDGSENTRLDSATMGDAVVNTGQWSDDGSRLLIVIRRASGNGEYEIVSTDGLRREIAAPTGYRSGAWVAPTLLAP